MTEIVMAVVYLMYTGLVCLVSLKLHRWWLKLMITGIGLSGLAALPAVSATMSELFSSLLSLALSVGVYLVLIVIFIRCMFPHHGRHWF